MQRLKKGYCFYLFFVGVVGLNACTSKVEVKTGDNYEIVSLPDNSEVYLNRHSSVRYEEDFDPRTIELRGEAFFIVSSSDAPFVVSTSHGEVTVLSTEFNVSSGQETLEVEVEEGQVQVALGGLTEQLKRGESVLINAGKDIFEKGKAKFQSRKWRRDLKKALRRAEKDLKKGSRKLEKNLKKLEKDVKKELK